MRYSLIPQERDSYCVCSVVQAIFNVNGIDFSQDDIAEKLSPIKDGKGFWVNDGSMKSFPNEMGFEYNYFSHNETPFNEPDMLLREMNENYGFLGINSHVYLLENFEDPTLRVIDPEDGSLKELDVYDILRKMDKNKGCFGLIEKLE